MHLACQAVSQNRRYWSLLGSFSPTKTTQSQAQRRPAAIATHQEQIESVGVDPRSDSSRVELNQYEKLNEIEEQIQE